MTYPYRCSIRRRCGKMVTLRHPIEWYIRRPKCPSCKQDTLKEYYCMRIRDISVTCKCGGVSFPHKRGYYRSKNEFCEHANVDLYFEGSRVREMKSGDPCPF